MGGDAELRSPEGLAEHRLRDVVDRGLADLSRSRAGARVPVQDQVGSVLEDRSGEPVAAEKGEDLPRLALERLLHRRVVQEDDPQRAGGDRLQSRVESLDLALVSA